MPVHEVARWLYHQRASAAILAAALEEPAEVTSSSENVLLALPYVKQRPRSVAEIDSLLRAYVRAVERVSKDGDAAGLLVALAEYGRRWEVIVETELALHEPSTVTLVEDRPLELQDGRVQQRVALGDARTTHAQFHVTDHAVEIGEFDVTDLSGRRVGVPILEGVRKTPESLAIYSAEPTRPYHVDIDVALRPASHLRSVTWALEIFVLSAIAAALLLSGSRLDTALGVVTIPTTFSVSLLLVRERSSLAVRLQRNIRSRLLVEVAVLWTITLVRLLL